MNALSHHLQGYLELRHGLGFKLVDSEYLLQKFVNFAQQQKAQFITTQLALRWSTQSTACHPARLAVRYRSVRLFAQYLSGIDSRTEIPPLGLLAQRYQRVIPYLYSNIEVAHLIEAAEKLRGAHPIARRYLLDLIRVIGGYWDARRRSDKVGTRGRRS